MKLKNIYLTIDDAPSIHTLKKIEILKHYNIPSIFFLRGEHILQNRKMALNLIENNFMIGNHSFSHTTFSSLTPEQGFNEILLTEDLIDELYLQTNKVRPIKYFRFPYGDQGGINFENFQRFLSNNKFRKPNFNYLNFIDAQFDIDSKDYKKINIDNPKKYMSELEILIENYQKETAILLTHDFSSNHELFVLTINYLLSKNINFKI